MTSEVSPIRGTVTVMWRIPTLSPRNRRRANTVCVVLAISAVAAAAGSRALASLATGRAPAACAERAAILAAAGDRDSRDAVVLRRSDQRLAAVCHPDGRLTFLRASSGRWHVLRRRPPGAGALITACAAA